MAIKIWVDDVRPMPDGYNFWCRSVNEGIAALQQLQTEQDIYLDLDHDAGVYAVDGGDYIRLLDFIEADSLNADNRFSFHIHSMNVVGRQNMMLIIQRRGWRYVY